RPAAVPSCFWNFPPVQRFDLTSRDNPASRLCPPAEQLRAARPVVKLRQVRRQERPPVDFQTGKRGVLGGQSCLQHVHLLRLAHCPSHFRPQRQCPWILRDPDQSPDCFHLPLTASQCVAPPKGHV